MHSMRKFKMKALRTSNFYSKKGPLCITLYNLKDKIMLYIVHFYAVEKKKG